jgi:Putative DnaT-like ssDNA binding protein
VVATFVVETGAGVAGANSYLSEADADQWHLEYGTTAEQAAWVAVSAGADRQQALRTATIYLDSAYASRWKGQRTTRTNPLDWPRIGATDTDGFSVDSDDLPVGLEGACAYLALKSVSETLLPDVADHGTIETISERIGPIARTRKFAGGKGEFKFYATAERLLHDLIEPRGSRMLERA